MYIFPTLYPDNCLALVVYFYQQPKEKLSHDYVKDGGRMTNNPKYIHSVTMEGQNSFVLSLLIPSQKPNHHHHLLSSLSSFLSTRRQTFATLSACLFVTK